MTGITIPSSVTRIGDYAFSSCNGLTDIAIPSSVKEIGEFAFCNSISSISVDENNPFFTSDDNVLYDKQKTNIYFFPKQKTGEYVIPNSVKKISSSLFYECKGLTSVIIPNSVTEIGDWAFYNCDGLESIAIPNSVTKIGEWTFYKCEGLKSIVIPNSVEEIGDYSFCDCKQLTSFTFSNSISVISEGLLSECTNLKKIEIPESVTTIKWFAFSDCKSLQNVVIPNSVKNIEWYVFSNCTNLKSIVIPKTVTTLGNYVFVGLSNLQDIYYEGTQQQWSNLVSNNYDDENDLLPNDNVTIHYNYVPTSLSITSHPANVTSKVNDSVSFSVKAQGDGVTYQWYYKKAGQTAWNKWGARTTATTTATANATWNGMQVYCKVTDQYGNSVDSNPATITIKQDLKITAQPTDKTVKLGESLTLSVKAEGIGLTYQWYYKKSGATSFSKWNGRTHASETVTPNASWNGIQLYCTVKDSSGNSLDSSVAKITVTQDLKITAQPTNKTIKEGDSVTLSLKAEGNGLTYQWYYKKAGATSFSTWNGRTHASETVTPNTTWNGIQLYCVVKDSSGKKVQSNTIKVLFSDVVTIVTQPTNVTAKTGDNVTFKFVAEGVGLTYQWYYKKAGATAWSKWNGRTTASTTATANASWDGMQVYCVVKNSSGSTLNSNIAKITLSDDLAITQQPSNVTTQAGQNVTFTVKAKGVGLKYQWQYKKSGQASWSNWGARTTASTTATSNATWNGMQVRCIVTDSAGNKITSNAATITIK